MKKITSILVVCLLQAALAVAASFNLKVELTPEGAGTLNTNGGSYEEGSKVNLRASGNTGYVFLGWYEGDTQLSTATSFSYTMPAHDAVVTAKFDFDPAVPADPDSVGTQYTVTLECKPEGGGSFNTRSATIAEGDSVRLYAYTNTGYKFLHWENELGKVITSAQNFYYVMPHGNRKIYGVFEFDPEPPGNPSKNYWNEETGEVIIDDFTSGRLSDALSSAIGDASRNQVTMITVSGVMTDNDFGIANNYKNCTLLDLSRVTGITEVPSYAFDNTNLENVYLPSTIEAIGNRAFYGCSHLASLTIYAMIPPALGNNVFTNVPEGLVVYVPSASIGLYQKADGWSNYTILPIQEDIHILNVRMPEACDVSLYRNNVLELTNKQNGQHYKAIINEQSVYSFPYLIKHTKYDLKLLNGRNMVLGAIDNISIEEKDTVVTFSSLLQPKEVSLEVLLPDNRDVTNDVTITWKDERGNYLCSGSVLDNVVEGYSFTPSISLPKELALDYIRPADTCYIVTSESNRIRLTLATYPLVTFDGKVLGNTTQMPLEGIQVSVSQMIEGKYVRTEQTRTDSEGNFSLTALRFPASITYIGENYFAITDSVNLLNCEADHLSIGETKMNPIHGILIGVSFTLTLSNDSEGGKTRVWSSGANDVTYEIVNLTKGAKITDFVYQYPQIIIQDDTKEGDSLLITAKAGNDAFLPVSMRCKVSNNVNHVVFPFLELGILKATYQQSESNDVMGLLCDSSGILITKDSYYNSELILNNIVDGEYQLVTIAKSSFFNSIARINALAESGLEEGKDYLLNKVTIESGKIITINNTIVPIFDDKKFYYTSSDTYFSVNKAIVMVGNYLTIQARLTFKEKYAQKIENSRLIVELPEGTTFVNNSVLIGTESALYELDNNILTIPVDSHKEDIVRFCIIPETEGIKTPTAYTVFSCDGKNVKQPLGSATYDVQSIAIVCPTIICSPSFSVSGVVTGGATVEVYSDNILVGQTKALANGVWATNCQLISPKNLSDHDIYAIATTNTGVKVRTETRRLHYDKNAIEVTKVHMYHWNPEQKTNYDVVFDFQSPSPVAQKYIYYIYNREFTFTVDFTDNDTTRITDVKLRVKTGNDSYRILDATYDPKKKCWIAVGEFGNMYDGIIPRNVEVSYVCKANLEADLSAMRDLINGKTQAAMMSCIDTYKNLIPQVLSTDDEQVCSELFANTFGTYEVCDDVYSEEELNNYSNEELLEMLDHSLSNILSFYSENTMDEQNAYGDDDSDFYFEGYHYNRRNCDGVDSVTLINNGYTTIPSTDGKPIYFKIQDDYCDVIDFSTNTYLSISPDQSNLRRRANTDNNSDIISFLSDWSFDAYFGEADILIEYDRVRLGRELHKAIRIEKMCKTRGFTKGLEKWGQYESKINKAIESLGKSTATIRGLATVIDLKDWYQKGNDLLSNTIDTWNLRYYLPELDKSDKDYQKVEDLESIIDRATISVFATRLLQGYVKGGAVILTEYLTKMGMYKGAATVAGLLYPVDEYLSNKLENINKELTHEVNDLRRKHSLRQLDLEWEKSGTPDNDVSIDPSGYVYEGVFSNRVEGATATVFYKETVEDMYGDKHENIVKWDAKEYAQENPLFTDANGYYRWDVPQGLWQVKFEKEGYETTYSEWLPVPPPQLDVNIEMKQNKQPEVKNAHAYEEAVEIEFDKYMMTAELNNYNIMVMQDGNLVEGTISLLNEEASYKNNSEIYASKVRFNAAKPFTAQEVELMVSNRVKSYAGIRMQDDFSQKFTVKGEIKQIVSDSLTVVGYGEKAVLTVSILPASASKGKTLSVKTSSPMILGVETEEVTIDNDGKAPIIVSGELPGTAALTFSVEGTDKTAVTITSVEQIVHTVVATPTANIVSGTVVEKGTMIELSCATEGATIYYTMDGSCPCDATDARKVYDGTPIIINETVTIKAIAMKKDMTDSDVAEFVYTVKIPDGIDDVTVNSLLQLWPLPVRNVLNVTAGGKVIKSVTVSSMNGVQLVASNSMSIIVTLDTSTIEPGIYIINVSTADGTCSRKVLKVE